MAYVNYETLVLRASAATSGASEQDAAVTLPEMVGEIWVTVKKTAENNIDNLLTVRLQAQVNSVWFDLSWDTNQRIPVGGNATAADIADETTRTPNISDGPDATKGTLATFEYVAHYNSLPTNIIRIVSVSSGTGVANTFSADVEFRSIT